MRREEVILVNKSGRRTGVAEKMEAHRKGLLHRAFSIFLFNEKGEMLLQKRAKSKYHFAGLWSNACCSHPRPGEKTLSAAKRRLREELGIECPMKNSGQVVYKAFDKKSGLTEHEFDYIEIGNYSKEIPFNPKEVEQVKWVSINELKKLLKSPEKFTPWLIQILNN